MTRGGHVWPGEAARVVRLVDRGSRVVTRMARVAEVARVARVARVAKVASGGQGK